MPTRLFLALLMLACAALQAAAQQTSAPRQLRSYDEIRDWQAVGLLQIGPRTCTGALIGPRHVATAAHCVMVRGRVVPAALVRFSLGLREDGFAVTQPAASIAVPREYVEVNDPNADLAAFYRARSFDLALITLPAPVTDLAIRPFALGAGTRDGQAVSVISYGRGRNAAPALQDRCAVLEHRGRAPIMDCDATFGSSGAPVFVTDGGERLLVSMISGGQEEGGALRTVGASRLDWLRAQLRIEAGAGPSRQSRRSGEGSLAEQLGRAPLDSLPQIGR